MSIPAGNPDRPEKSSPCPKAAALTSTGTSNFGIRFIFKLLWIVIRALLSRARRRVPTGSIGLFLEVGSGEIGLAEIGRIFYRRGYYEVRVAIGLVDPIEILSERCVGA